MREGIGNRGSGLEGLRLVENLHADQSAVRQWIDRVDIAARGADVADARSKSRAVILRANFGRSNERESR